MYRLTWKEKGTPAGRSLPLLAASVRPRKGSASTGWPTPSASDGKGATKPEHAKDWAGRGPNLPEAVQLAGWPTPAAVDSARGPVKGGLDADLQRRSKKGDRYGRGLPTVVDLAAWPTPLHADWRGKAGKGKRELPNVAELAGWPTPNASDGKGAVVDQALFEERRKAGSQKNLQDYVQGAAPVRLTGSGEVLTGSSAGTRSSGQLSPEHSRWLMGLPAEWDACADTAMRSSRRRRLRLSKRSSKRKGG